MVKWMQWVIAREPSTGRIWGYGIRINPFILDEPLRKVAGPDGSLGG